MNYTLQNRGYFDVLKMVADDFNQEGVNYALVGGTGIQSRISDISCRAQKTTIPGTNNLEHVLRPTNDLDITSDADEEFFTGFFNRIQALNHPNVVVLDERPRSKKIVMSIKGKKDPIGVFVNYQTGPQDFSGLDTGFYSDCLETATDLILPYRGSKAQIRVATPECLVASKLTRSDPKDIFDISTLLRTMKTYRQFGGRLDENVVKAHLERAGKGYMVGRLAEIKAQITKE
ncbi:MAG: nucleotidyl transferase AbiEii/AbiGii toxin family protein [Nanoarchaeota archaeon]|mgnify:CR=1 FL=1